MSRTSPICSELQGYSRLVLVAGGGISKGSRKKNIPERVRDTIRTFPEKKEPPPPFFWGGNTPAPPSLKATQFVMKEIPWSELQAKFFADTGEKRSEILAKNFADFRPFNFQDQWPQGISRKILVIFHEGLGVPQMGV